MYGIFKNTGKGGGDMRNGFQLRHDDDGLHLFYEHNFPWKIIDKKEKWTSFQDFLERLLKHWTTKEKQYDKWSAERFKGARYGLEGVPLTTMSKREK